MIYPHFIVTDCLDHQSALFTPRNDRVYSHYEFPLVGSGELAPRSLHFRRDEIPETRARALAHQPIPSTARSGFVPISDAWLQCTLHVTPDLCSSSKFRRATEYHGHSASSCRPQ